jgi:hypothetical protein
MTRWRYLPPILISAGLIVWLLTTVSLPKLAAAAAQLQWQLLVPATVAMVLGLYFWDGLCLKSLYALDRAPIGYWRMLRVRGMSYLIGAVHCQLGQAMVVWNVARLQENSLISTLSRGILLLYHDALVLMSAGLAAALLSHGSRAPYIRAFCGISLACLLAVPVVLARLPASRRMWLRQTRWGAGLDGWTWRRSAGLLLLRTAYYSILGLYAVAALRIGRIDVDLATALAGVPLVLLADALPSISGLGTRDTALYLLFGPDREETLLAMGLFWWSGLVVVRLLIGMAHLWFGRGVLRPAATPRCLREGCPP